MSSSDPGERGAANPGGNEATTGQAEPGGPDPAHAIHESETVFADLGPSSGAASRPAGSVADLDEFKRALIELGLVNAAELAAFEVDASLGVLGLARALVRAGRLTPYQSAAIYQNKSRGLLIGKYLILDKLGQGGMGVVFKARRRNTGKVVALKILPPSFARDHQAVSRFKREIEAAGRLNHPNIVAALDADEDRGVHFLVMEYVEGRDLDRVVQTSGPMPVVQAVDCLIQAARGLEAAHAQGIVHRDIKPGNLMLDAAGNVRVLDLGLARIVEAANPFGQAAGSRLTQSGMYMGTIDYMAPEQAEDSRRADQRADIYSLGCTLFYLLTGREPFEAETILKRLMAHQERPAPKLRAARPDAPPALETVFQQMMAKRPAERPATMTELIALLESCKASAAEARAAAGEPPKSRPELKVFDEPLKRAAPAKTKAEPSISTMRDEPQERLRINEDLRLEDLVMDVRPETPPAPLPASPKAPRPAVDRPKRAALPPSSRRRQHTGAVVAAVGAIAILGIILARFTLFSGTTVPPPARSGSAAADAPMPTAIAASSESRDTRTSASQPNPNLDSKSIFDGTSAKGWMLRDGKPLPQRHVQPDGLNPRGSGSYLVVYEQKLGDFVLDFDYKLSKGCNSGVFIHVSDLNDPVNTGIEVQLDDAAGKGLHDPGAFYGLVPPRVQAQKPPGVWNHMTVTARGPVVAVSLNGTAVSSINLDDWPVPGKRPDGSDHKFRNVAIARLPRTGYVGFQDHGSDCWFKNIVLNSPLSSTGPDSSISIAGRGAATTPAQPATLPEPYIETARFIGHEDGSFVEQVRLLPDGKRLLTAGQDKTARLWDLKSGREIRRLWHPAGIRAAVVLRDGRRAVTGCNDGFVRLWDLETGREIRRLAKHTGAAITVTVSADGRWVLSGGDEAFLRLSDVETQVEVPKVEWQSPGVWSLAISHDGQRLLAGCADGIVRLGDLKSNAPLSPLEQHSGWAFGVAFAPDDRHAVSSCIGQLIFWDLGAKKVVRQRNMEERQLAAIALANSHRVVFCSHFKLKNNGVSNDGRIGTWDFDSDDPPLIVHRGAPGHLSLALLPDGGIVTGDVDGLARVWEPSASIARAREMVNAGKTVDGVTEYGKAIAKRPDDARLLIERGRVLSELGRASEADADFTRAARLAPDNPQLFIDAGWWLAGPYPPNFDLAIESDSATDPSKPPPPSGTEPRQWRRAPTRPSGLVDMTPEFASFDKNVAGYAMTTLYSATERKAVLLVGTDDMGRVWFNGRQVLDSPRYTPPGANPIEVTLQPGRNTILARVVNTLREHGLYLRISDKPVDFLYAHFARQSWEEATKDYARALAEEPSNVDTGFHHRGAGSLARTRRWKEAIPAYKRSIELNPGFIRNWYDLAKCEVALDDLKAYRSNCAEMVEKFAGTKDPNEANMVAWAAALAPNALPDYRKVLNMMKPLIDAKNGWWGNLNNYGALLYRAGQYQGAIRYLNQSIERQKGKGSAEDWVFIAMARHRLRQPGDQEALETAKALAGTTAHSWDHLDVEHLLEEARQELALPPPL
ncbi:MAG: protein kinase domain-containing protein [Isosphaeraceae bacterium]